VPDQPSRPVPKRRRRGRILFWASTGWLALVIGAAALADVLPLADPNKSLVGDPNEGPSLHTLLGTDQNGRDLLARIIFGGRVTLVVGFASIAFGLLFGGLLGLTAGYYRGRVEAVLMAVTDVLLSFPQLVFLVGLVAFVGRTTMSITLGIGVLSIAPLARVVRGATVVFSQREFVRAARVLGATNRRILFREVLPNVVPAAVSFSLIGVAVAIVAEGGLSFLGLSVNPSSPTWGGLINSGQRALRDTPPHPHVALFPAAVLFLTVLALNFAGDRLRSMFDVREAAL
jgi:peptide/nickel transport system permease protein